MRWFSIGGAGIACCRAPGSCYSAGSVSCDARKSQVNGKTAACGRGDHRVQSRWLRWIILCKHNVGVIIGYLHRVTMDRTSRGFEMSITLWSQFIWLCALALGSFLVSWIFTDLFHVPRTAYVAVFAVVTGAFLYGYFQWSHLNWASFISHQWLWGLIVAGISGLVVIALCPGASLLETCSRPGHHLLP